MNYHQYEPGNGTKYTLWCGRLESPHYNEEANVLIWQDPYSLRNTIFTFPTHRDARVSDITEQLGDKSVFQGDVAALAGFVKTMMHLVLHDPEGVLTEYDSKGRWVGDV